MSNIKENLDLDKVPHYTTLQSLYLEFLRHYLMYFIKNSKTILLTWRKCFYYSNRCNWIYEFLCKSLLSSKNREAPKDLLWNFNSSRY